MKAWGEDFELGRAGANFTGSKGAGRNSSGSSWVGKLPLPSSAGAAKNLMARGNGKGKVRSKESSKPAKSIY